MTKDEKAALLKKYKRPSTKSAREKARWERMLSVTNGGLASPEQLEEQRKRQKEAKADE